MFPGSVIESQKGTEWVSIHPDPFPSTVPNVKAQTSAATAVYQTTNRATAIHWSRGDPRVNFHAASLSLKV